MSLSIRSGHISERQKNYAAQRRLCQRMVQVSSVVFLPAVLMRRMLGAKPATQPSGQPLSVFAEAKSNAASVIPFIFMG